MPQALSDDYWHLVPAPHILMILFLTQVRSVLTARGGSLDKTIILLAFLIKHILLTGCVKPTLHQYIYMSTKWRWFNDFDFVIISFTNARCSWLWWYISIPSHITSITSLFSDWLMEPQSLLWFVSHEPSQSVCCMVHPMLRVSQLDSSLRRQPRHNYPAQLIHFIAFTHAIAILTWAWASSWHHPCQVLGISIWLCACSVSRILRVENSLIK